MIETIYLDMDGVLADFDFHFENLYGITCKGYEAKYGQVEFWRKVYKYPRFFSTMPLMPGAIELLNLCLDISADVCILSSPSTTNNPLCILEKRKWIDQYILTDFPAIFEKDKYRYAHPKAMLIDDHMPQITKFINAGGMSYHYDRSKHNEALLYLKNYKRGG